MTLSRFSIAAPFALLFLFVSETRILADLMNKAWVDRKPPPPPDVEFYGLWKRTSGSF